ncbi:MULTISPECIES: crotonase/enoyl-CoA hydratase family protein [unclassified Sphingobium]|uniref:crotonase/enoyl-CoA hydratase family protein n=1 Tax=unclassified Sphingobium TaxID=2611147 RepID=UPI000D15C7AD|nr:MULTISPECIES: crotonase/enoyl-CoA hydratase family protein [unclassified Sphingobium]MBG6120141.1 enoyl-CoA hydratase [Sphingobium sp. JAI105]PSO12822.1 enoyl-CoA hydratase [Sphingobium sp. AEW4]TWD05658.1 enoyl-CoA hydratase [Sphingobium sp. AEW010]TWD23211.1 enoyl-CoA hydratase [Sphingobium sp. AEW013]TWD25071.1 enoyl-CoA hydratase [Sphingobium sp. AEW001]
MTQTRKWLKSTETITFDVRDHVAWITLNRPDKRNTLSKQLLTEVHQALLEADDLADAHVIVLQGEGRDFCAGYDLGGSYGGGKDEEPEYDAALYRSRNGTIDDDCWHLERQQALTAILLDLHKPMICKVQGYCLAGGTDLALSCDIIVAADDAKIGFPAARANGTPPTNLWLYHVGPQWAKRMLFTGDTLKGADAARIGLVLDAYPAEELDAVVAEMARRIACVDAEILSTHKRVVNMQLELMGAKTSLRFAAEADARAHLAQGPLRTQFRKDVGEVGLKQALKNRDALFGDSVVKLSTLG